jgi:hypothetical protein
MELGNRFGVPLTKAKKEFAVLCLQELAVLPWIQRRRLEILGGLVILSISPLD